MSTVDQLLSRALLVKGPHVPADVVPYNVPCRADAIPHDAPRCGACDYPCPVASAYTAGANLDDHEYSSPTSDNTAADHLNALCEAVVNRTATTSLNDLITETLPAPRGARLVGCILLLADAEDSARFWWQYAAGAGDEPAGYCLYLHHLSHGDTDAADWWLRQTGIDPHYETDTVLMTEGSRPAHNLDISTDVATILRVLTRLADPDAPHRRTEMVSAVMDYVASAVATGSATNPGAQIPLPPDFAEHLDLILAAAAAVDTGNVKTHRRRVLVGEWLNS